MEQEKAKQERQQQLKILLRQAEELGKTPLVDRLKQDGLKNQEIAKLLWGFKKC